MCQNSETYRIFDETTVTLPAIKISESINEYKLEDAIHNNTEEDINVNYISKNNIEDSNYENIKEDDIKLIRLFVNSDNI